MLASLPMYDLPEIRDATDAFWAAVAKAYGTQGPLRRDSDWSSPWHNPQLLLSQTCGYPFTHQFAGVLDYVATPHYAADGCEGANYCSIIFARKALGLHELKGQIAAFNSRDSMSGMLALKLVFAPLAKQGQFFTSAIETGGHVASLRAVQNSDADVCACDCVTAALLRVHRPSALEGLVEIARSPQVPGLPFVTRGGDVTRLRRALTAVLQEHADASTMSRLLLTGASVLSSNAYDVIPKLEGDVASAGDLNLF